MEPGTRLSVKEKGVMCHVYHRNDNLGAVLIADDEYPQRVAHALLTTMLDEFTEKVPTVLLTVNTEFAFNFTLLPVLMAKYQDPRQVDTISRLESDLDETTLILKNTIEAVLERGERLDDLIAKSEELSFNSKSFYTVAKKNKSCCHFG